MDLAEGHLSALRYLQDHAGLLTVNLGTGRGTSVLEMVAAFEKASGRRIPLQIGSRRAGDVAQCWLDPSLANRLLGWTATRGLDQMCADAWRWECSLGIKD
jgi:UDP-glucose 4-epimerase